MPRFSKIFLGFSLFFSALALLVLFIPIDESGTAPRQLADPDGQFMSVQGWQVYVRQLGETDAPTLVLVHGLFGGVHTWRDNMQALAEAGYRVIAYDRLGNGLSDKDLRMDFSLPAQADFLAELLDSLDVQQAVVLGHSAGTNVLAHFALRHPERLAGLVWVDAAVLAGGPPPFVGAFVRLPSIERAARLAVRAVFTPERLAESIRSFQADASHLSADDVALYARTLQTPRWELGLIGLTRDSSARLTEAEWAQIAGLDVPNLIVWGEADSTTPFSQAQELARRLSNATLISYAGVGHQPMEEVAERFNADVTDWLASLPPVN